MLSVKNGKVISFINMKGGVGKTTLCVGLGEYLANFKDKKILFIDIDPQFNTTQSLMDLTENEEEYMNDYRKRITIRKIFEDTKSVGEEPTFPEKEEAILSFDNERNIDLICGTIDLIKDDNSNKHLSKRLKFFIEERNLKNLYDYIFIDCPPTISFYTDAALYASDFYVIPTRVDRYSILGIKMLENVVKEMKRYEGLTIKPLGIVYTMRKIGGDTHKSTMIRERFEAEPEVSSIGVFENSTYIVNDLMVGLQGNISSKYARSKEHIKEIAEEFLRKIEIEEGVRNEG